MDKLLHLSSIIKHTFAEISADENRKGFIFHFQGLLKKPLVKFNEGYNNFIGGVTTSSDTFDLWLSIQMRIITALGNNQDALKQLGKMVQDVLSTTEGGEVNDCSAPDAKDDFARYSFIIALAFRVYLDDFPVLAQSEPVEEGA